MKKFILLFMLTLSVAVSTAQNNQILQNAGLSAPRRADTTRELDPQSPSWHGMPQYQVMPMVDLQRGVVVTAERGYNTLIGDTIPPVIYEPVQISGDNFQSSMAAPICPPVETYKPMTQPEIGLHQLQQEFLSETIGTDYEVYDECTVDSFVKLVVAENDPLERILVWSHDNPQLLLESNFAQFQKSIVEVMNRQESLCLAMRWDVREDYLIQTCKMVLREIANLNLK